MKVAHTTSRTKRNVKRILITVSVTAGVLTVAARQASAGMPMNHSEATLR
jgi:hypothetical protein